MIFSSKMSALQEKNSVMQSELLSLELKLSTAVSERSAKEETIATINEVSKKRVCELKAELETATKSNSKFQKELHHVNGLRADILGLAHSNQTLQQEKQKLALMVKEYEAMKEDNISSVLEDLKESKNRTKALEEILYDVECERNSLQSQICVCRESRSHSTLSYNCNLQKIKKKLSKRRFCSKKESS